MNVETNIYFQNKRIRDHLIRAGLINRQGEILQSVNTRSTSNRRRTKSANRHEKQNGSKNELGSPTRKSRHDLISHESTSSINEKSYSLSRTKSAHVSKKSHEQTSSETVPVSRKCCFIFIYNGLFDNSQKETKRKTVKNDEIHVLQQLDDGKSLTLFKNHIKPIETFSFYSRRCHEPPFRLMIKINGIIEERLYIRCECRPHRRPPIGGRSGTFTIFSIQRIAATKIEKEKKVKKKKIQPLFVEEPPRYQKSAFPTPFIDPPLTSSGVQFSPVISRTPSSRSINNAALPTDEPFLSNRENENSLPDLMPPETPVENSKYQSKTEFDSHSDDERSITSFKKSGSNDLKILDRGSRYSSSSSSSTSTKVSLQVQRNDQQETQNRRVQDNISLQPPLTSSTDDFFSSKYKNPTEEEKPRAPSPRFELLKQLETSGEPRPQLAAQPKPTYRQADLKFEELFKSSTNDRNNFSDDRRSKTSEENSFWDNRPTPRKDEQQRRWQNPRAGEDMFRSLFGDN